MDRDFGLDGFRGYTKSIVSIWQVLSRNLLVTVGMDEDHPLPIVKMWNMDKEDKGGSRLVRALKLKDVSDKAQVTCFACMDDLSQLAVGLSDGSVVFFAGDLVRDQFPKQKVILERSGSPATGMGFRQQGSTVVLFVATQQRVVRVITTSKDFSMNVLDDFGCNVNCSCMTDVGEFAMGRDEAVYFYTPEGRGACRPFEGVKVFVTWFRSYLLIVSEDAGNKQTHSVNIYNLQNQFNAYTVSSSPVTHVASEWGSVFLFCQGAQGGRLYRLDERDTQTKLETLFRRGLYNVALSVAQSQNYDEASIIDIHRKFGDHLYSKSEFDAAIESYVRTIGYLEPSYVIRKFLDAQRIRNLTTYLQALHQKGVANADHTTLLLNCFAKSKDLEKLNEFIHSNAELNFDVETAIKVCRQAGYHEHALELAKKHNEHKWYLKILLEDMKNYAAGIKYIRTLGFFEAELCLKQYGKALISEIPQETTQLLKELCTKYEPTPVPGATGSASIALGGAAGAVASKGKANNNAIELSDIEIDFGDAFPPAAGDKPVAASRKTHPKAIPDEYLHIFIDKPDLLMEFLESVIAQEDCSPIIYTTLLEAYLRQENEDVRAKKCIPLLVNPRAKFDNDQALVLCQMYNFGDGVLLLYKRMELYQEIVSHYMEEQKYKAVLDACASFSERDPMLWVQALAYFAEQPNDCEEEIRVVLKHIEEKGLLTPIRVIQILSKKETATLAVVKDFIVKNLQEQAQRMEEDQAEIRKCKEETKQMRQEIDELTHSAKVFQQSRCSICKQLLALPSVHFLCMHSFHQGCLDDRENQEYECPLCGPKTQHILQMKQDLDQSRTDHDAFFKKLNGAKDGFGVVAEYFGRGMFNPQPQQPQQQQQSSQQQRRKY